MNTHGRYRKELMSVIGMFVNAIPLRCKLDPHWSFQQLLTYVQEIMTDSLEYSYFPLQRILAQHPNIQKPTFLDTAFGFHSITNENIENEVIIGGNRLHSTPFPIKISEDEIMSKFDFALTIQYASNTNQLLYTIDASLDLFDTTTVDKIAQQFHSMLTQLFNVGNFQIEQAIHELSIVLPDEKSLIQSMNNTEVLFHPVACIHHEFVFQARKHPQKLAVELDDQSLTYSEVLYYAQVLSLHLMNEHGVVARETICQCVERSLSMVSCGRKY
jgi:syringomycin synthetase protein SyrE